MRIRPRLRAVLIGLLSLLLIAFILVAIFQKKIAPADLVLINGDIHTLDPARPEARALVVRGNRIAAVCFTDAEAKDQAGRRTELIDLGRGFVLPGLIDGHVHFDKAGALINDANLMAVSDEEGLRQEIRRVVALIGPGEWITEGLWGAYERRASSQEGGGGGELKPAWRPHRRMIDDLTPGHPCFLCRFDNIEWLANGAALREAGLETQPVEGMELDSDGKPTGIIFQPSPAFDRMRAAQKPKSHQRLLAENRAALKMLRESGIVEIHDIAAPDQIERFVELEEKGELTCRVWLEPGLSRGLEPAGQGFAPGLHPKTKQPSKMLRYGPLEGDIDGIMGAHGALLSFGSDWPGTSGWLCRVHPKYLIYAAVTRQSPNGEPLPGWFPERRMSVEEAIRAYTLNNALAVFEGQVRGSLQPGKLADITVFDRNLLKIPPQDILRAEVLDTIVDGKVVFRK